MKVKTRRWRSRNNPSARRQGQNNGRRAKLPEQKENASGVEGDSFNREGNCSTYEEKAAASTQEASLENGTQKAGVANDEAGVANDDAGVVNDEADIANNEPNNENQANAEINPPAQAVPASDDEDSGTENDRNDAAADGEAEGEKESYQVEVARTMSDIVHTRDMLFSLTKRVDQLLEFCKILQTKQNHPEPEELRRMQQILQQHNTKEGAGKPSQ